MYVMKKIKGQIGQLIAVTVCRGSQVCDMSRLPNFIESRLKYDDEVVSLIRRPPFTPEEYSWFLLCWTLNPIP
jgi:hypothetical protein